MRPSVIQPLLRGLDQGTSGERSGPEQTEETLRDAICGNYETEGHWFESSRAHSPDRSQSRWTLGLLRLFRRPRKPSDTRQIDKPHGYWGFDHRATTHAVVTAGRAARVHRQRRSRGRGRPWGALNWAGRVLVPLSWVYGRRMKLAGRTAARSRRSRACDCRNRS